MSELSRKKFIPFRTKRLQRQEVPSGLNWCVDYVLWIDRLGLLIEGWLHDPRAELESLEVTGAAFGTVRLDDRWLRLERPDVHAAVPLPGTADPRVGFFCLVQRPQAEGKPDMLEFRLRTRNGATIKDEIAVAVEPKPLMESLASRPLSDARAVVEACLRSWVDQWGAKADPPAFLRDLAKRLRNQIDDTSNRSALQRDVWADGFLDDALQIAESGILLNGWFATKKDLRIREFAVVSLSGHRVVATHEPITVPRPDVSDHFNSTHIFPNDDHGFLLYIPCEGLTLTRTDWNLEIVLDDGYVKRLPFELGASPEPLAGIQRVLSQISPSFPDLASAFKNTIGPCVESFWAEKRRHEARARELSYGNIIATPQVSVVVPLYGRIDFVRFQIALFYNDPDFIGEDAIAEIVYVLDDPPQEAAFRGLCRAVHETYRVPFRTVILSRNLGVSGAYNAGARRATGELLLLLNSDVMPKHAGWLSTLVDAHGGLPDCGAIGCRLLSEDGSIQHAGMDFRRSDLVKGGWENLHPYKGYPVKFDRAGGPVEVAAVTAACLLVERSLYAEIGGLDEDYILGDFEDSDLCLRLRERGLKNWYLPSVELYHLERQSIRELGDSDWRTTLTLYNMWKHGRRWGRVIEDITGGGPSVAFPLAEEVTR